MKHQVQTAFKGNMAFEAQINEHKLLMDTTVEDGGNDAGPSPKRLMLAALAGCTGIDVVSILNKMQVSYSNFDINIEATLTEEHPKIYDQVEMIYSIKIKEEDRPKMQRAVELSQEKYCGVSAMFKAFAQISYTIVYV